MLIRNSLRFCKGSFKSLGPSKTWTNKVLLSKYISNTKENEPIEEPNLMKSCIAMSGITLTSSITNVAILLQNHFTYVDALGFSVSTILPALYSFHKTSSIHNSLIATRNSIWLSISVLGLTSLLGGANMTAISASAVVTGLGHGIFYIFNRKTGKPSENLTGLLPAIALNALAVYGIYDYVGDLDILRTFGIWSVFFFPPYLVYLGMTGDEEIRIKQKEIIKCQLKTQKHLILALHAGFIFLPFLLPLFWLLGIINYFDNIERAYKSIGKDKLEEMRKRQDYFEPLGSFFSK